jgi:chaperonin GroES
MKKDPKKQEKIVVKPLGARVLIRPYTKEELLPKNSFGIILPGNDSKEKSEQGIVLAIGPGEFKEGKLVPIAVSVGDKVIFSKYSYEEVKINGSELYLIKEENILAVIKNN